MELQSDLQATGFVLQDRTDGSPSIHLMFLNSRDFLRWGKYCKNQ